MPAAVNGMKRCTKCRSIIEASGFHKDRNTVDGLASACKSCRCPRERKRFNERYTNDQEFRERQKARDRDRYANDPEYRERTLARANERYAASRQK